MACRALEKHCTNTEQRLDNKDLVCSFSTKKNLLCVTDLTHWGSYPGKIGSVRLLLYVTVNECTENLFLLHVLNNHTDGQHDRKERKTQRKPLRPVKPVSQLGSQAA